LSVSKSNIKHNLLDSENRKGSGKVKFLEINIYNSKNEDTTELKFGEPFKVQIRINSSIEISNCLVGFSFVTKEGFEIQGTTANDTIDKLHFSKGINEFECLIDPSVLTPNIYYLRGAIFKNKEVFDHIDEILSFYVHPINSTDKELPKKHYVGNIYIDYKWKQLNTGD
jgi:hypothetical protein